MKHVELCGVLFEHLREGELLDGASTVIRWINCDVSRGAAFLGWWFDGQKPFGKLRRTGLGRTQAEEHLKEVV
jgi:hypothetical protein